MKRILAISLLSALAFNCISCDRKEDDKKRRYTTTKSSNQKVETKAKRRLP